MTLKLDELAPLDTDRSKQVDEEDSGSEDQDMKQLIHEPLVPESVSRRPAFLNRYWTLVLSLIVV
ncbi:MAG: hypothetical protein Q9188_003384 [Gyalolechia gomerana]